MTDTQTPAVIHFQGNNYSRGPLPLGDVRVVVNIETMTGPRLVGLYNLLATNLADTPNPPSQTRKFADLAKGVKRTWDLLERYKATVEAETAPAPAVAPAAATPTTPAAGADDFTMSDAELSAQKTRQAVKDDAKVQLSDADKKQIKDEAADRKPAAKRGSQAGAIRKPREPKADDGAIKMPTEGGKQRAKRQKDGSYAFRIPAGRPRTKTISEERQELIDLFRGGEETWATIKAVLDKPNDFNTVTTITMFCITLGFGLETQPDGLIKLIEPLEA